MERDLVFHVKYPQLEVSPYDMTVGRKKYDVQKNSNSPDFILGKTKLEPIKANVYRRKAPIFKQDDPRIKNNEDLRNSVGNLKNKRDDYYGINRSFESASTIKVIKDFTKNKFIPTDRNHNPYIDKYVNHPLFNQPKYTKNSPRVDLSDPIIGYSARPYESRYQSPSPEKNRLATYGNLLLSSNNLNF